MDIKVASIFFVLLTLVIVSNANAWETDTANPKAPVVEDEVPEAPSPKGLSNFVVKSKHGESDSSAPASQTVLTTHVVDRQEIVILNTAQGFVPANVRLHKGLHYLIHIVNVNEDKKNVSFVMDAFNQHHATYYGQVRTFELNPDREGIFDYECPETTSIGKLIVFGPGKTAAPAPAAERSVSSESEP